MTALRYNPLTYSSRLQASGISQQSADIMAQEQADIFSSILNNDMATKKDIQDILKCIYALQQDIKTVEYKITMKVGAMMAGAIAILTFLLKHV